MKRAMLFACLGIALAAGPVVGAEPPTKAKPQAAPAAQTAQPPRHSDQTEANEKQAAEITGAVIPKREIVFEEQEQPFEIAIFSADPEALQQQFAAIVRLDVYNAIRSPSWKVSGEVERVRSALKYSSSVPTTLLRALVQNAPRDRLPSPDLVEELTARTLLHVRDYHQGAQKVAIEERPGSYGVEVTISFIVLAPTSERAKELTRAVITLLDCGFSYPMQREFLLKKQPELDKLATLRASLSEIETEAAGYEKEMEAFAEYEDVTQEALNGLITQQRLISVDLAGVRARITACTKILAGNDQLRPSQIEQVEQIKITAEIELVGLEARKAAIDSIVGKAAERRDLWNELTEARARGFSVRNRIQSAQSRVDQFESLRGQYEPLPIKGGAISIHPIKWISPEDDEPAS